MSETGVAVLGGGLSKTSILNILLVQSPVFHEHALPKHSSRVSAVKSLLLPASLGLFFSLLECTFSAKFGAIRRTVFGVFRRYSALVGAFRRFSARFGARTRRN